MKWHIKAEVALVTLASLAACSSPPKADHTTRGCRTEDEIVLEVKGDPYTLKDGEYVCVHIDNVRTTLDK